ncbi:MAG: hypothetical protein U1D70_02250 [Methylobacter sp.]|nr:hypothetical protein [Methylobacter sp.]MDP2430236.1 hypothetical protein [Methylobacter sp.]MDP3056377.1 hypothetical protein [Methylobacter sp.]MDP3362878.1 hypothetical protein [Methylobacter sp.]MDZ4217828.1 hypothetical protein [Methylobacter sp.]
MSSISFSIRPTQQSPTSSAMAAKFTAQQTRVSTSQPQSAVNDSSTTISQAARDALAASSASSSATTDIDKSVEARLAEIKAKGAVNRSLEDHDFLFANDKRLAEITAQGKSPDKLTADELDYMQKAAGFINTMANLSPAEKALYDKAVASGNSEAAAGISQIAFIRTMGHTAGGADGSTYDPLNTEITAANIGKYFSHSIVDPSGKAQSQFQALIQYLQDDSAV